tara:strand:- start:852 stop:1418 length:567 start_codon:yes stop_codon:yes gene_type:complete
MVNALNQIKSYCNNKSIIIIGNSSSVLHKDYFNFISEHDVIVRMNWAVPVKKEYIHRIGERTDMYAVSISSSIVSERLIKSSHAKFALRLTPNGETINNPICYTETRDSYREISSEFTGYKPSTGSLVIKFFKDHIDYSKLSIIGYDFFNKSNGLRNEFKSFKYKDHCSNLEEQYITRQLNNNTKIYL